MSKYGQLVTLTGQTAEFNIQYSPTVKGTISEERKK
jgi:hypothetical protein